MIIQLILSTPHRGIIRSPFLDLDPTTKDCQYTLQVKWGYSEYVNVEGPWKLLIAAIKTAIDLSGITIMRDSCGQKLQGTDQQLLKLLECFNPNKNSWPPGAKKWYEKLVTPKYVLSETAAQPTSATKKINQQNQSPTLSHFTVTTFGGKQASSKPSEHELKYIKIVKSYDATHNTELTCQQGEVLKVTGENEGWYYCQRLNNNETGYIEKNDTYVTVMSVKEFNDSEHGLKYIK